MVSVLTFAALVTSRIYDIQVAIKFVGWLAGYTDTGTQSVQPPYKIHRTRPYKTEAESREMQPQGRELLEAPGAGESKKDPCL